MHLLLEERCCSARSKGLPQLSAGNNIPQNCLPKDLVNVYTEPNIFDEAVSNR